MALNGIEVLKRSTALSPDSITGATPLGENAACETANTQLNPAALAKLVGRIRRIVHYPLPSYAAVENMPPAEKLAKSRREALYHVEDLCILGASRSQIEQYLKTLNARQKALVEQPKSVKHPS